MINKRKSLECNLTDIVSWRFALRVASAAMYISAHFASVIVAHHALRISTSRIPIQTIGFEISVWRFWSLDRCTTCRPEQYISLLTLNTSYTLHLALPKTKKEKCLWLCLSTRLHNENCLYKWNEIKQCFICCNCNAHTHTWGTNTDATWSW